MVSSNLQQKNVQRVERYQALLYGFIKKLKWNLADIFKME